MTTINPEFKINPKYQVLTRPYTTSEYKRLKDSIRVGQELPIIIDEENCILDGHHRLKVCEELGIKPKVEVRKYQNEEQKIRAINQLNYARRHCNKWELYMAAERIRPEFEAEVKAEQELKYQKGKKGTQPIGVKNLTPIRIIDNNDVSSNDLEKKDGRVNRKIGDIVGVSRTTIWQWKQVKDNYSEQDLKALGEGRMEPRDLFKKMKAA